MSKSTQNQTGGTLDRLGLTLLIAGSLANLTLWVGAFVATEKQGTIGAWILSTLMPVLGGISGLAMAFTVAVGLVYVLARLAVLKPTLQEKVRGKKGKYRTVANLRFYSAAGAVVLLLIISPAILAPYVLMVITGSASLYDQLGSGWARAWAIGRVIAADLALGAVALVHGVRLHAGTSARTAKPAAARPVSPAQSVNRPARTAKHKTAPANRPPDPAPDMRVCDVPDCGISYRWPNGKGAHYKKYHPDLTVQKAIPARVALPIDQQ